MKRTCQQIEKLLPAYSESDLNDEETRSVSEHLDDCSDCRRELELQETCWQALEVLESDQLEPSSMIRARVWEQIRRQPVKVSWWQRLSFRLPAAAATLVLGFWFGLWISAAPPATEPVVASTGITTPAPLDKEMVALASDPGYSLDLLPDPANYQPLDEEFRVALNAPPVGEVREEWFSVSDDVYAPGVQFTNFEP